MNPYLQVFRFLLEFSKLRNSVVRDIDNYESVFWLSELPQPIQTILTETQADYWLKAPKPKRVEEPTKPEYNNTSDIEEYDRKLSDYKHFKEVSSIYRNLFEAYKKIQNFGDEYELLMGMGLLYQNPTDKTKVRRHIFTVRATIEFSTRSATIEVKPDVTNARYAVELDMCSDVEGYQINNAKQFLEETLENVELDFFSETFSGKDGLLSQCTNILNANAQYFPELAPLTDYQPEPTVYFAPALILRKRNARNLTVVYEKIIEQLEQEVNFDASCLRTVLEADAPVVFDEQRQITFEDETIYFPKQYNAEQIRIVERLQNKNAVLVQGPPGTGKSHTIANLLCHLLAHGNRVLVTAQTQRALESLKDKIPDEVKPLVVSMLGDNVKSTNDLEASVNGITNRLSNADIDSLNRKIEEDTRAIAQAKKAKANYETELNLLRSNDLQNKRLNARYEGELEKLAQQIAREKHLFEWFTDAIGDIRERGNVTFYVPQLPHNGYIPSVIQGNFENLHQLAVQHQSYSPEDFRGELPSLASIIAPETLQDNLQLIGNFQEKYINQSFEPIADGILSEIPRFITEFEMAKRNLHLMPRPQDERSKRELERRTKEIGDFLAKESGQNYPNLYNEFNIQNLINHNNVGFPILRNNAQTLLNHLEIKNQNKIDFGFLSKLTLPQPIKNLESFTQQVGVNDNPCVSKGDLKLVIRYANFRIDCSSVVDEKFQYSTHLADDLRADFTQIKHKIEQLDQVAETEKKKATAERTIQNLLRLDTPIDETQIETIKKRIDYTNASKENNKALEQINLLLIRLQLPNLHLIAADLAKAINDKNSQEYRSQTDKLKELHRKREEHINYQELLQNYRNIFPNLVANIAECKVSQEQIASLTEAIYWQNAHNQLLKMLENTEESITIRIKEAEKRIEKLTEKLAANKAWIKVLARIDSDLSRKLTAWSMAMQRAKGNGQKAMHSRKVAQELMSDCQTSIPCWIMPLPKLAETLQPNVAIYDYVIVDEASQLGPDALFLMYLAKNIIVVGDDKQTAPYYVGIANDLVNELVQNHLQKVPLLNNFLNTDYSFFDQARIFCSGQVISLREHFRCMPEIIGFSNQHFYQPAGIGLYPLKQYKENRLDPLKAVFVNGGYVEGTGAAIKNPAEADEIVAKIQSILKDENYKGKTLGVIALQGQAQAQIINQKLLESIDPKEYEERQIVCGDAKGFQGDERDIILLSLVTAPNHSRSALTTPDYARTFNVASSRAKEQMWLFHSVKLQDLINHDDLRYKLLQYFINPTQPIIARNELVKNINNQPLPNPFDSIFEIDVYNEIVNRGYSVIPQYNVGNYRIDLVVVLPSGIKIAVECDGDKYHSTAEQIQNDIIRQKILERAGWQFFRVRGGEFYYNKDKAMEKLWGLLERNCQIVNEISEVEIEPEVVHTIIDEESNIKEPTTRKVSQSSVVQTKISPTNDSQLGIFSPPIVQPIPPKQALETEAPIPKTKQPMESNQFQRTFSPHILSAPTQPKEILTTIIHEIDPDMDFEQQLMAIEEWEATKWRLQQARLQTKQAFETVRDKAIVEEAFYTLIFTNKQRVYTIKNEGKKNIQSPFGGGEKQIYTCETLDYSGYMIFGFENGKVAKVHLESYKTAHKVLESAFDSTIKLRYVKYIAHDVELVAHSKVDDGRTKCFIFNTSSINPVSSRNAKGVQVMNLGERGGKLDGIKEVSRVKLTDKAYYYRQNIPQTGVFLRSGDKI